MKVEMSEGRLPQRPEMGQGARCHPGGRGDLGLSSDWPRDTGGQGDCFRVKFWHGWRCLYVRTD